MQLIELFEESVSVLRTNKLRTALSALGIIIGIASVITLMTLGAASQKSVTERIQSLGANLLTVSPGSQQDRGDFLRSSGSGGTTLTYDDAEALATSQRITTVDKVAGVYSGNAQVSYGSENDNIQIAGITENYFELRNIELLTGQPITEQDNLLMRKVIIIGESMLEDLMEGVVNPVGETIRINGDTYTIIGVIEETESFGFQGNTAYIPLFTAQHILFGVDYVSQIYVGAKSEDIMEEAENQIGWFLLERHGLDTPDDADFSISSQEDILETVNEVTQTFTTLLTGIAAISLVVGGIGIMNIMLVTVTERTREIGIRKALGAKRRIIVVQFLIESVILTFTGGFAGVLLGLGISAILTKVMSLPSVVSFSSILISVVVSCVIGIVFGIYPAQKASRLQPIEALRYE
ncbi:ABC transporter permease [Patescibacteria group bacterium]|nr:ABC transporter permease [Patescibacteria group bacterium]